MTIEKKILVERTLPIRVGQRNYFVSFNHETFIVNLLLRLRFSTSSRGEKNKNSRIWNFNTRGKQCVKKIIQNTITRKSLSGDVDYCIYKI